MSEDVEEVQAPTPPSGLVGPDGQPLNQAKLTAGFIDQVGINPKTGEKEIRRLPMVATMVMDDSLLVAVADRIAQLLASRLGRKSKKRS